VLPRLSLDALALLDLVASLASLAPLISLTSLTSLASLEVVVVEIGPRVELTVEIQVSYSQMMLVSVTQCD
jgi:hypothetical protein